MDQRDTLVSELNDIFNLKLGIHDEGLYVNKEAVARKINMLLQKDKQDWRKGEQVRE